MPYMLSAKKAYKDCNVSICAWYAFSLAWKAKKRVLPHLSVLWLIQKAIVSRHHRVQLWDTSKRNFLCISNKTDKGMSTPFLALHVWNCSGIPTSDSCAIHVSLFTYTFSGQLFLTLFFVNKPPRWCLAPLPHVLAPCTTPGSSATFSPKPWQACEPSTSSYGAK